MKIVDSLKSWHFVLGLLLISLIACDDSTKEPAQTPVEDMEIEEDKRIRPRYDLAIDAQVDASTEDASTEDQLVEDAQVEDAKVVTGEALCQPCSDRRPCADDVECKSLNEDTDLCIKACDPTGQDATQACPEGSTCEKLGNDFFACVPENETCIETCIDQDGDGYGIGSGCLNFDCNDQDNQTYIGASDQSCNNVDNDCDGYVDEAYMPTTCGTTCMAQSACMNGIEQPCVPPVVVPDDNCDGLDNDCDQSIDEDYMPTTCGGNGLCANTSSCQSGQEIECTPLMPPSATDETCDSVDDDCDGDLDEEYSVSCGQGICVSTGFCNNGTSQCFPLQDLAQINDVSCNAIDEDCDGNLDEDYTTSATCGIGACQRTGACVAGQYACTQGEPLAVLDETCDGIDDNCNGVMDENCQRNLLKVRKNEALSSSGVLAVDVYYEQIYSPAVNPLLFQPVNFQITIIYPNGLTPRGAPPLTVGNFLIKGPTMETTFKDVSFLNFATNPPNSAYIISLTNSGPGADARFPPLTTDTPNEVLMTLVFNTNNVPPPYQFTWHADTTTFFPEIANEALRLNNIGAIQ